MLAHVHEDLKAFAKIARGHFGRTAHEHGWASRSALGKLIEEGLGAGQLGRAAVEWHLPEVFTGRPLLIRRAIEWLNPDERRLLAAAYFAPAMQTHRRAALLGLSPHQYRRQRDRLHHKLDALLEEFERQAAA